MAHEQVPIAIIGMGCRFPGTAKGPEAFWSLLAEGRHGWTSVPETRFNEKAFYHPDSSVPGAINQKGGHFLDQDISEFDAGFFGISPLEAENLDPQQRIILETTWEAVENAGIPMDRFRGSETGVYVAMFCHDYEHLIMKDPLAFNAFHNTGAAKTILANRISYAFDLHGPSFLLDTGCSGSLVAVNSACQSLAAGETDMAVAGGVTMIFSPDNMAVISSGGLLNGDGRCFSFDERGAGFGRGEGVGIVALKRLDDAIRDGDNIRSIIRASGANQDGRTNGITLPNQHAQERLARKIFQGVAFEPKDVQYAEAHGTGTKAGDQLELTAIKNVFCEGRSRETPLMVGTSKPNIGHSEAAAGVAGLIKSVLAMEKGLIPPNILLEKWKPTLKPNEWNVKVSRTLAPWPATNGTRKVAVNSFGSGGTNAMVVLESHASYQSESGVGDVSDYMNASSARPRLLGSGAVTPEELTRGLNTPDSGVGIAPADLKRPGIASVSALAKLFPLSSRSEVSGLGGLEDLRTYLQRNPSVDLNDLSYTLTSRRSNFPWRTCVAAEDASSLIEALASKASAPAKASNNSANVFVFTGQGAQWAQMGHELVDTDTAFSKSIHRSDQLLQDLGASWSLVEELAKPGKESNLNNSKYGQPSSTAIQVAIVDLLKSWGVLPTAVVGHSSGEIAAAYAAGAISHDTAIKASYHRSFLSDAAKQRAEHPGAMMAVGLGEEEVETYLKDNKNAGAIVACVNSPSSTTISGDAPAVAELKEALDSNGIFARQLKVDTAYHSHHMSLVRQDYFSSLGDLESGSARDNVRVFSSVTGEEKTTGFGASYWVDNLVSQVRFDGAVKSLCQAMGQRALNFVEIGPHKALAGPLRQIMTAVQVDASAYNYVPTLLRGEDARSSLLETASTLFKIGSEIDLGVAGSIALTDAAPVVLRDLPKYHWDHSTTNWNEPRLSREHRSRKNPHHDLLGYRILTSPDTQPSWRNIQRIETLPWLRDHVIDNFVVFPAAGYLAMAIEAIKQLNEDRATDAVKGYRLRKVSFKRALTIPKESRGVETVLSLHETSQPGVFDFSVSSVSDQGSWQEHCEGTASSVDLSDSENDDEISQEEAYTHKLVEKLAQARGTSTKSLSKDDLYSSMAAIGNQYGPSFAVIEDVALAQYDSTNNIVVPDIAAVMPSGFQCPHVVHPAPLDAVIQTYIPLFQQYSKPGSTMPIRLEEVFVSANVSSQPGQKLEVLCSLENTMPFSTGFNATVFQKDAAGQPQPVITMTGGEARIVGAADTSQAFESENIFTMKFALDMTSVTPEMLEAVEIPLQAHEAGMTYAEKVRWTDTCSARYIDWAVREVKDKSLTVVNDNRAYLYAWMQRFVASEEGQRLISESPATQEELTTILKRLGVEGETILRMGSHLTTILTGQTDALNLFLEDNLLWRVYHADTCARPNHYLADYLRIFTTQRRNLRILEIGAGTGGTTHHIFETCSPSGETFCSEYVYTDISPGFFETARTSTLKEWADMLTFETLDLEKDLVEQGFEPNGFDFIVAANVVHATYSIPSSLRQLRRLLKPGGQLGLVEVIKPTTPFLNTIFGSIDGWWAGAHEGRTEGPFQTPEQWDAHFLKSSFSGVDMVAYDLPEPERYAAFLVSTAVADPTDSVPEPQKLEFLSVLPEMHPVTAFGSELEQVLGAKGHQSKKSDWEMRGENDAAVYVVLDAQDHLFLEQASSEQFSSLVSLLTSEATIYWVTLSDGSESIVPDASMMTGLARTARNENDKMKFFTIDVQHPLAISKDRVLDVVSSAIANSQHKIATGQPVELELMYRKGELLTQRLVTDPALQQALLASPGENDTESTLFHQEGRVLKAAVGRPGLMSSLTFVDEDVQPLAADEIEIQAFAWGVNTVDTMVALGQTRAGQSMLGESAGVVTQVGSEFSAMFSPGDRVALLAGTPYASRCRTQGQLAHKIPETMSFAEAASVPAIFSTAYYGLMDIAGLQKGQSVLIHSATSNLGQAALKVSSKIGAVIFATVQETSNRDFISSEFGVPRENIISSQSPDFAAAVKHLTGDGVDVVFNTLASEGLHASWECVAPMGTFIMESSKDTRGNQLSMDQFNNNVRFASVDIALLARARPQLASSLLGRVFEQFAAGNLSPPARTILAINDIEKAFRQLASSDSLSKVVLEADEETMVDSRMQALRLSGDATYILAGATGGFGRKVCRHLQSRGARNIVVFSRRSFTETERAAMVNNMTEIPEAKVELMTCDVLDKHAVAQAAETIRATMPPVKGLIQSAMLLVDRTLPQMTLDTFREGLSPKYQGTKNLTSVFGSDDLDFFVNLSSVLGLLGSLGQANYAAGNVFQDMVAHSQVSAKHTNFVTLNFPLIQDTLDMSPEAVKSLARQGCQNVSAAAVLPVLDFAMSGQARKAGCHQVTYGLDPQPFIDLAKVGAKFPPLFGTITAQSLGKRSKATVERSAEDSISEASTMAEAEQLILKAIQDKVSSLIALSSSELDLDVPVTNLGLDSLVAIELRNWIKNALQAPVQTSDIMDAASLKTLAAVVLEKTSLVKRSENSSDSAAGANVDTRTDSGAVGDSAKSASPSLPQSALVAEKDRSLPKYPLQPLETTMDLFHDAVIHLGTEEELQRTQQAVKDLLSENGMGRTLQKRLQQRADDPSIGNWFSGMFYANALWLRERNWHPRLHNFFGTTPASKEPHTQAERATVLTLSAFAYKRSLDDGTVETDYQNEEPLSMDSVYWLFNTNRTPAVDVDVVDRYQDCDFIVAMKNGHAYKIPLRQADGSVITHGKLKAVFQAVSEQAPAETNWLSILTTDNRNEWARIRSEVLAASAENVDFVASIEKSLFTVCLEDATPTTPNERASAFLLDDNRNRWLDKTLSFVVAANGESALFCEHAMVDGTTFQGIISAVGRATVDHVEAIADEVAPSANLVAGDDFRYLPVEVPSALTLRMTDLRARFTDAVAGYTLQNFTHEAWGASYLREQKLPPKSVFQVLVQTAVRQHLGYNPNTIDVVNQRHFQGGRLDSLNAATAEVVAFCAATQDPAVGARKLRELFVEAVKSHARLVALLTRGRGWSRHIMGLREALEPGEQVPALLTDPVYLRTKERRMVYTNFLDAGLSEMGNCWADREAIWSCVRVSDNKVDYTIINGNGRTEEFIGHLQTAAQLIKGVIETTV